MFFFHLLANLQRLVALGGMGTLIGMCYMGSSDKSAVSWPRAFSSLGLQLIMGILIAYTSVYYIFLWLGEQVKIALSFADQGGDFVFASYDQYGKQTALAGFADGSAHATMVNISHTEVIDGRRVDSIVTVVSDVSFRSMGGNFAIGVLPSIIFFSAFVEVSKNDEFCIKNVKLCIKNEKLCIKNEGFCVYK